MLIQDYMFNIIYAESLCPGVDLIPFATSSKLVAGKNQNEYSSGKIYQ